MSDKHLLDPRAQQRNFWVLLGDFAFFGVAFVGILNPRGLLPVFVAELSDNPVLIGFAGMLFFLVWHTPQLLFAWWVNRAAYKKRLVIFSAIPARAVFFPAALVMLAAGPENSALLILVMLAAYAVLAIGDSFCVLGWLDILGSSISDRQRSWMLGLGEALVNLLVVVAVAQGVRLVLNAESLPFPDNYALLLLAAGTFLLLSTGFFFGLKEGPSPPPEESPPTLREYARLLRRILDADRRFRRYMAARFVYTLVEVASPFYIVYATNVLGQASADAVGDQLILTTSAAIVAALVFSRIGDRYGTRLVIRIGTVAALLQPLLALAAGSLGLLGIHLVWIAFGVVNTASILGFLNWVVEYAPPQYRPIYAGLNYTNIAAALLLVSLGGVLVEVFSYAGLFWMAAGLGLAALLLLWRLPEPRHEDADLAAVTRGLVVGD